MIAFKFFGSFLTMNLKCFCALNTSETVREARLLSAIAYKKRASKLFGCMRYAFAPSFNAALKLYLSTILFPCAIMNGTLSGYFLYNASTLIISFLAGALSEQAASKPTKNPINKKRIV